MCVSARRKYRLSFLIYSRYLVNKILTQKQILKINDTIRSMNVQSIGQEFFGNNPFKNARILIQFSHTNDNLFLIHYRTKKTIPDANSRSPQYKQDIVYCQNNAKKSGIELWFFQCCDLFAHMAFSCSSFKKIIHCTIQAN